MIQKAGRLLALFAKGLLTLAALIAALASLIFQAKQAATSTADAEITKWSRDHGQPDSVPLGLVVDSSELPRLTKALQTVVEAAQSDAEPVSADVTVPVPEETPKTKKRPKPDKADRNLEKQYQKALAEQITPKVERLVSAEVKQSEWDSTRDAIAARGVTHWRWVALPTACKYCKARNGKTYKIELKFRDHPNCSCTMTPVETKETENA